MDLEKLENNAGRISELIKRNFLTERGINAQQCLLFAAGLAGYACHMAVRAKGESFVVLGTEDGKRYYTGEDLLKYIVMGQYSVLSSCDGFFESYAQGETKPDPLQIAEYCTGVIGNKDYKIWSVFPPSEVFPEIQKCWDNMNDMFVSKCCENPEEWPVLYAIVLQNMMVFASQAVPHDTIYKLSLEAVFYISKMDTDSI